MKCGYIEEYVWTEKKTKKEVLNYLEEKIQILKIIKTKQLRYFGHVKKRNTILKIIY